MNVLVAKVYKALLYSEFLQIKKKNITLLNFVSCHNLLITTLKTSRKTSFR
jgi:hypothetical protein